MMMTSWSTDDFLSSKDATTI